MQSTATARQSTATNATTSDRGPAPVLTAERARQLWRYERSTGKLYWRERPSSDFDTPRRAVWWNRRYEGHEAGYVDASGYRKVWCDGRLYRTHRLVWLIVHGEFPPCFLDHLRGDVQDNRIEHLASVTKAQSSRNQARHSTNTSGITGVSWARHAGKWVVAIGIDGRNVHLGLFTDKAEAILLRKMAEFWLGYPETHGRDPVAIDINQE